MQTTLYLSLRPAPPLDAFVEQFWYWQGPQLPHLTERIMPTGTASIIINLFEDELRDYNGHGVRRLPAAILVGARSQFAEIDTAEQRTVIGIQFLPGGTWPFFDCAGDELLNGHYALTDLWGAGAGSIREQILCARTPMARLETLQTILWQQVTRPVEMHPALAFTLGRLHRSHGSERVETLSRSAGASAKRLARLFAQHVGLTPKLYARVLRFNRVLNATRISDTVDWCAVAHQHGYFDQSHFIRDFKVFSGFTPSDYLVRRTPNNNHVRL